MREICPNYWILLLQSSLVLDWIWASNSWACVWTFVTMFVGILSTLLLALHLVYLDLVLSCIFSFTLGPLYICIHDYPAKQRNSPKLVDLVK